MVLQFGLRVAFALEFCRHVAECFGALRVGNVDELRVARFGRQVGQDAFFGAPAPHVVVEPAVEVWHALGDGFWRAPVVFPRVIRFEIGGKIAGFVEHGEQWEHVERAGDNGRTSQANSFSGFPGEVEHGASAFGSHVFRPVRLVVNEEAGLPGR